MMINVKKIIPKEMPVDIFYVINSLQFDEGIINIISKESTQRFEFFQNGDYSWNLDSNISSNIQVTVSEFPDLKLPWREMNKFKINKLFINKETNSLSNFLLFQALLKKVDKELFLLPMKERILVYLVFDSNKKFVGQYTLSDTGYGDFNCQINPQFTLDVQNEADSLILNFKQNEYDNAYYKVYGPKKELEAATKQLEAHKKQVKDRNDAFKNKWSYLFK